MKVSGDRSVEWKGEEEELAEIKVEAGELALQALSGP